MTNNKYTTDEVIAMSDEQFTRAIQELPNHAEELATGMQRLPESRKPSAKRLLDLLLDDAITQIAINGPNSAYVTRSGKRTKEKSLYFVDVEAYYQFFNEFILPLTDITERLGDDILFEGFLSLPDSINPGSVFPRVARLHTLTNPVVESLVITLAPVPRS